MYAPTKKLLDARKCKLKLAVYKYYCPLSIYIFICILYCVLIQCNLYKWGLYKRGTSISGEILVHIVHFHTNEPLLAEKWGMEDLNSQGVIILIQKDLYKWGEIDKSQHDSYKLWLFNAYSTHSEIKYANC